MLQPTGTINIMSFVGIVESTLKDIFKILQSKYFNDIKIFVIKIFALKNFKINIHQNVSRAFNIPH